MCFYERSIKSLKESPMMPQRVNVSVERQVDMLKSHYFLYYLYVIIFFNVRFYVHLGIKFDRLLRGRQQIIIILNIK